MLKSKIIIGIIVAIVIVIGIGYSTSSSEYSNNLDFEEISQPGELIPDDSEGKTFTLKLEDTVSATGP